MALVATADASGPGRAITTSVAGAVAASRSDVDDSCEYSPLNSAASPLAYRRAGPSNVPRRAMTAIDLKSCVAPFAALAHDQHGDPRLARDTLGDRPGPPARRPAAPVRAHDDQVLIARRLQD